MQETISSIDFEELKEQTSQEFVDLVKRYTFDDGNPKKLRGIVVEHCEGALAGITHVFICTEHLCAKLYFNKELQITRVDEMGIHQIELLYQMSKNSKISNDKEN